MQLFTLCLYFISNPYVKHTSVIIVSLNHIYHALPTVSTSSHMFIKMFIVLFQP